LGEEIFSERFDFREDFLKAARRWRLPKGDSLACGRDGNAFAANWQGLSSWENFRSSSALVNVIMTAA